MERRANSSLVLEVESMKNSQMLNLKLLQQVLVGILGFMLMNLLYLKNIFGNMDSCAS
jgi:hypothetical protein